MDVVLGSYKKNTFVTMEKLTVDNVKIREVFL